MVQIDKLHAFEVCAVSVNSVAFKGCVVVRVYTEGAQKPFEVRFVSVCVEEHTNAVFVNMS